MEKENIMQEIIPQFLRKMTVWQSFSFTLTNYL